MSAKKAQQKLIKYPIPFNIRVDEVFLDAVKELRRMHDELPTQSDVVRQAVLEALQRKRRERRRPVG